MKKAVYTAIFSRKDDLKQIDQFKGIDYIVFTDDTNLQSEDFKVIVVECKFVDPVRNARYYKVLSHKILPTYDYSLWIDASISINGIDINSLFNQYLNEHDIALDKHPDRNCIYDEAKYVPGETRTILLLSRIKWKSIGL